MKNRLKYRFRCNLPTQTVFFILFYFIHHCILAQDFNSLVVHKIDSIDSDSFNSSGNLKFLESNLKNKRIVLLGEPTHGEGNVFVAKTNLIKYLHENLGFNVIAFESGFYDLFMARKKYVIDKNFQNIQTEIFPIWTQSKECVELFRYLEKEKDLKIVGFDNQIGGTMTEFLVDSLQNYIVKNKIDDTSVDWEEIDEVTAFMGENLMFPPNKNYQRFFNNLATIKKKLLRQAKNDSGRDFWVLIIDNLQNLAKDYSTNDPNNKNATNFKAKDSNPRDFQMAQNLSYLLNLYKNEKFICWGANTHFIKSTENFDNDELADYQSMSYHLSKKYATTLYSIGFTSSKGSYGISENDIKKVPQVADSSMEAFAEDHKMSHTFFDLSNSKQKFLSSILEYKPVKGNWNTAFDAIIYLDSFTPSHKINAPSEKKENTLTINTTNQSNNNIKHLIGRVIDEKNNPVPYCSIYISPANMGAISNSFGVFSVDIPRVTVNDSIRISSLGFKSIHQSLKIKSDTVLYQLSIKANQLDEVVVKATKLDANRIMQKAIKNIPQNYYSDTASLSVYFNMLNMDNDTVNFHFQILSDVYLSNNEQVEEKINDKLSVLTKPQNIKWEKYPNKESIIDIDHKYNFVGLNYFGLNSALSAQLFNEQKIKKYNFKLVNVIEKEGQKVFVISFESLEKSHRFTNSYYTNKYYGTLYINDKDFAILKCDRHWQSDTSILNGFSKQYFEKVKRQTSNIFLRSYRYLYEKSEAFKSVVFQKGSEGYYLPVYSAGSKEEQGFDLFENKKFKKFSSTEFYLLTSDFDTLKKIDIKDSFYALKDIKSKNEEWNKINLPVYEK